MMKLDQINKSKEKEGSSMVSFGSTIIQIGGCDNVKEICYNDVKVMNTLKESELQKKILK